MDEPTLIASFTGLEVAVVGDLMMDEYVWGQATRVSPESPVLVISVERESAVPGGAANVAANLMALGARVRVFGAVGDDSKGVELKTVLASQGADVAGIVTDSSRPTTRKTRVVAQSQQVLRVDRESTHAMPDGPSQELAARLKSSLGSVSAVLVSDYAKGVVNDLTIPPVIAQCRDRHVPFLANGKPDNAALLSGATVVTLNVSEALATSGDKRFKTDDIHEAGESLRDALDVEALVVTRGAKGLCVWNREGETVIVPAHPAEVYDVAGAGDTVVSTLTLALAAGADMAQAARLAVRAAAIVVSKVGVATVSASELLSGS